MGFSQYTVHVFTQIPLNTPNVRVCLRDKAEISKIHVLGLRLLSILTNMGCEQLLLSIEYSRIDIVVQNTVCTYLMYGTVSLQIPTSFIYKIMRIQNLFKQELCTNL